MSLAVRNTNEDSRMLLSMPTPSPTTTLHHQHDQQERERTAAAAAAAGRIRTLLDLLNIDKMDSGDRSIMRPSSSSRWRFLKDRLGLKSAIGCCGTSTWLYDDVDHDHQLDDDVVAQRLMYHENHVGATSNRDIIINNINNDDHQFEGHVTRERNQLSGSSSTSLMDYFINPNNNSSTDNSSSAPTTTQTYVDTTTTITTTSNDVHDDASGMNLAAALAAERQMRTPVRVSLMKLLEERESHHDHEERESSRGGKEEMGEGVVGSDSLCCVCMGRKKGAAMIPCGHTFCRICSKEVWLKRGSCPLCNRQILEILHIF